MTHRPRDPRTLAARRRDTGVAYVLLAPALLLLAVVLAYPIAWEVWISLTDFSPQNDGPARFVGLANYRRVIGDASFAHAALVTTVYAVVTSVAKLALGVGFALLLARPFRGQSLVFLAIFLPWAYPAGVSVIGWFWTMNPSAASASSAVMTAGRDAVDAALGTGAWALASVALFNIWRGGSFMGIFLLAGINAVPAELFDAGLLECRGAWQRFWRVTVPLLRPFLAVAVFLSLTGAFWDLANVWSLTGGRVAFPVIGTLAYWLAILGGQFGPGAALSLTMVPPLLAALLVLFRLFDRPAREAA
jgi:multiple sugar transport system permease protein